MLYIEDVGLSGRCRKCIFYSMSLNQLSDSDEFFLIIIQLFLFLINFVLFFFKFLVYSCVFVCVRSEIFQKLS
jgi:hypothetical protein